MMDIPEFKELIDTYYAAGKSREETVAIVSAIPINGEASEAFEYIDLQYQKILALPNFNLTDAGNAEHIISLYGDTLRYDHSCSRWLHWDKHFWKPDTDKGITRLAMKAIRERYKNAVSVADLGLREKVAKWAIGSEQRARTEAMLSFAKDFKPIADNGRSWDKNSWLFCVKNGIIDLRTGELRPGEQADMITMESPLIYDKEATCPLWLEFLDQTTDGNEELKTYLQRAVGYSMTGETKAQLWFFLYGLGTNGKTTFTMTIRRLMGDYGTRIDSDDLMIKDKKLRGSNPKEGVADTRGKRYAIASEVQDGKRLDMGLLKDMTGQDTLKARRLYEHEVEFLPTHKLWMFGNHKPGITDTTNAAWRRLKLIPFSFTVPDNEIDMDLQTKLDTELPGILNWAIAGCLEWQKEGLNEPVVVIDAVATYRHDSDILADFIEDCCVLEFMAATTKPELKNAYEAWCKEIGQDPITRVTFKTRLTEKGVVDYRGTGGVRAWRGIRVKTEKEKIVTQVTQFDGLAQSPPTKGENETLCVKTNYNVTNVTNGTDNVPDYPKKPCQCGSSDYWLVDDKRWLCCRCHPEPTQANKEG